MRNIVKIAGITLLIALLGAGGIEANKLIQQHALISSLEAQISGLRADAAQAREQYLQTKAALDRAHGELATIDAPANGEQFLKAAERQAWLARAHQLGQLFAQRPDQVIPEMRLLTDIEWLQVARDAEFDTDENIRKALARVRDFAKSRFVSQLDAALRRYTKASGGQLPADISQLSSYFDAPPDSAMLERYSMTRTDSTAGNPTDWAIEAKDVIDPDHDGYFHVQATGGYGSSSGPGAEFSSGISRAMIAFQNANNGARPKDLIEVLPYFNPPLDPVREKRFLDLINRVKAAKP